MRPSFVTDEIIKSAENILSKEENRDPMLIIDMDSHKIEVSLIVLRGHNTSQLLVAEKWELQGWQMYERSPEKVILVQINSANL